MGFNSAFKGLKQPGHGVHQPPLTSTEVKERVELYLGCHPPTLAMMASYRVSFTCTIREALNYAVISSLPIRLRF